MTETPLSEIDRFGDLEIPLVAFGAGSSSLLRRVTAMGIPAEKLEALQLSFEGLLKLRQKDPEAFWEKMKGITTLQETKIATIAVETVTNNLKAAEGALRQLQNIAG